MSFTNWLKKMKEYERKNLLYDLVTFLEDDDKADLVEHLVTELNEDGYEWDYTDEPHSNIGDDTEQDDCY